MEKDSGSKAYIMVFVILIVGAYVVYDFISGGASFINHMVTNSSLFEKLFLIAVIAVSIYFCVKK